MLEIEITQRKGIDVIDSLLLHKKLNVKSHHKDWLSRRLENYSFEKGVDYFSSKMSETKKVGRPSKSILLTLDMAKELCMLENNDIGKATRKYFIKCEKQLRKTEVIRLAGKEVRKSLTDAVQESVEQERMHGRGYSNYTRMVYEVCGLTESYKDYKLWFDRHGKDRPLTFRDYIRTEELKRVELAESLIKPLLELDKQYSEIKDTLKPLFERKEVVE
jgi:phage anti-repressor protein